MITPGPIIYQNQPSPTITPRFSWPFFIFRLLSIILVLVILFMIFQAVMLFITRQSPVLRFGQLSQKTQHSPSLTLSPEQVSLMAGQTGTLTIDYFTGTKTIQGVDLLLKYDPNIIEFKKDDFFQPGKVFTQYPITEADPPGTVRISAVATISQIGFNGSGQLGSLRFIAKRAGQTKIEVVFEPDKTTESNLVELQNGTEILKVVRGATINVK